MTIKQEQFKSRSDAKQESEAPDDNCLMAKRDLVKIGKLFFDKNWVLGTSGNFSALLPARDGCRFRLLITASGRNKGELCKSDFVVVDENGSQIESDFANGKTELKPSAETLLHVEVAKKCGAGSILHTHSLFSTLLTQRYGDRDAVEISGLEMLKGLAGVTTHDTRVRIKIFENTQDMQRLSQDLSRAFAEKDTSVQHAFLIRGHGLYTWGKDVMEARRHIEILEFLFELLYRGA